MSFNRVLHYRFRLTYCAATAIVLLFSSLVANLLAQEAVGTPAPTGISAPSLQPVVEPVSNSAALNPTGDSNLHSTTDLRNEVTAEPRRFQYGLQVTMRGVYDDNINISQSGRVSDYYFTIEPVLTLGLGDIVGHQDNYIRLDYAPSLFIFADHTNDDALQQLIHLEGQRALAHLTLTLAEEIAILDGTDLRTLSDTTSPGSHANLDVSGRTRFQTYNSRVGASYDLSGKTFLSKGIDALVTQYDSVSLISSEMFSGNLIE